MTMGVIGALGSWTVGCTSGCGVLCAIRAGWFFSSSSSMDKFCSEPEFIFHILLQIFIAEQQAVPALPAAGRGVGDVAPGLRPAYLAALALHQRNELLATGGVAHTVVDDVHELELFALATGCRVILRGGHGLAFPFLFPGLKHRERQSCADLIVALPQFLELLLGDVQFLSSIEVDGVDEEVGMDVRPVCVGADQDFAALIVLSQLQRRCVSGGRIHRFAFREALHHVVEQHAVRFVVEPLGGHEVCVDRLRLAVDPRDQRSSLELRFLILHGVAHHGPHAPGGLSPLVVGEADDGHSSPPLSFQKQTDGGAEF